MDNTFFARFNELCRAQGKSANGVAKELGIPSGSVTAWKRGSMPRNQTLVRLAEYFGVSVDYLAAAEKAAPEGRRVTQEDIKFALFGGEGEITDAMYQEVRQFAQYVKFREGRKKE